MIVALPGLFSYPFFYFIVTYFISVSDNLLAPSFDCINFIDFSIEERTVSEITI